MSTGSTGVKLKVLTCQHLQFNFLLSFTDLANLLHQITVDLPVMCSVARETHVGRDTSRTRLIQVQCAYNMFYQLFCLNEQVFLMPYIFNKHCVFLLHIVGYHSTRQLQSKHIVLALNVLSSSDKFKMAVAADNTYSNLRL